MHREGQTVKMTEKKARKCRRCRGAGVIFGSVTVRCLTCHGTGIAGELRTVKRKEPLGRSALQAKTPPGGGGNVGFCKPKVRAMTARRVALTLPCVVVLLAAPLNEAVGACRTDQVQPPTGACFIVGGEKPGYTEKAERKEGYRVFGGFLPEGFVWLAFGAFAVGAFVGWTILRLSDEAVDRHGKCGEKNQR